MRKCDDKVILTTMPGLTKEFFAAYWPGTTGTSRAEKGNFRFILLAASIHFRRMSATAQSRHKGAGAAKDLGTRRLPKNRYQADMASPISPDKLFEKRGNDVARASIIQNCGRIL